MKKVFLVYGTIVAAAVIFNIVFLSPFFLLRRSRRLTGLKGGFKKKKGQSRNERASVMRDLTLRLCNIDGGGSSGAYSHEEYSSLYPPLNYSQCSDNAPLNVIPFFGGMTNAMKMVMLGALMSFEEDRCFYVDDEHAHLNRGLGANTTFVQKYLERPIGLSRHDPYVEKAFAENRVEVRQWYEYWESKHWRRSFNELYHIPNVFQNESLAGHELKRRMLQRMWKPRDEYQAAACDSLKQKHGLINSLKSFRPDEYIAFSIRRGDKTIEDITFTDLAEYIATAEEEAIPYTYFGVDRTPKIFVATDDCSVMPELRRLRPEWKFFSECSDDDNEGRGFVLRDVPDWTEVEHEQHFRKFFTELHGLALSRFYIGVRYTNVTWWVYFMRPQIDGSVIIVDRPDKFRSSQSYLNYL